MQCDIRTRRRQRNLIITAAHSAELSSNYLHILRTEQNEKEFLDILYQLIIDDYFDRRVHLSNMSSLQTSRHRVWDIRLRVQVFRPLQCYNVTDSYTGQF